MTRVVSNKLGHNHVHRIIIKIVEAPPVAGETPLRNIALRHSLFGGIISLQ